MLFLVPKMTTNSGESCAVDVLAKVFAPTGGNPDGFKGLRGLDCNAAVDKLLKGKRPRDNTNSPWDIKNSPLV